ncbi:MAG: hypothetical protein QOC94_4038, partial [Actinoplanes sp.]|nr:hypothetical protein [Actinoplanes sp.]
GRVPSDTRPSWSFRARQHALERSREAGKHVNAIRYRALFIPAAVAAMLSVTSCSANSVPSDLTTPHSPSPTATAGASDQTSPSGSTVGTASASAGRGRGGRSGGGPGGRVPPPPVPVDWPAAVPLPTGTVQASTGTAPRWSVLIFVPDGAGRVQQSTTEFYRSHGFSIDRPGSARRDAYRVTFIAENRDHSATETNLTIAVTRD